MSIIKGIGTSIFLAALAAASVYTEEGCKPAQQAEVQQIADTVLQDVKQGKSLPQIETDIAIILNPSNPVVDAIVVTLANDVLDMLIATGVIPAQYVPHAKALLFEAKTQRDNLGK